jgi:small subunit ribosomal protein S13
MRIAGITLAENKRIEIGLTEVFGIGRSLALSILKEAGVDFGKKPSELTDADEAKIKKIVDGIKIEGDLKRQKSADIKRLIDISSYRGSRHIKKLPARGQNTKTNSRTIRGGGRKTMGSGKIKVTKK